jgi:RNA polymerase sigma factor (sigma-70 family)
MTVEAGWIRDDRPVADLVRGARNGEQRAWDALVERYAPLVWSICQRNRLGHAEAGDVSQTVWLRLVEHLDELRDPAALPGWLATTTQRECYEFFRATRRVHALEQLLDAEAVPSQTAIVEEELLAAERHETLLEAVSQLPPGCQRLLALLIQDPPVPYAEISLQLGVAVGSIGPSRRRCLERLRRSSAIAALIGPEALDA